MRRPRLLPGWGRNPGGWRPAIVAAAVVTLLLTSCGLTGGVGAHHSGKQTPSAAASAGEGSSNSAAKPLTWLITAEALRLMERATHRAPALRGARLLEILGSSGTLAPGASGVVVIGYRSEQEFAQAVASGQVPAVARAVLYDPEDWSFTPAVEQRRPAHFEREFAIHAARQRLIPILAPALDLVRAIAPGTADESTTFLNLRVLDHAASALESTSGYVEIQGQSLERTTSLYRQFVVAAAAQIRQGDAKAHILAGLSTNPPGGPVTLAELRADVTATRDVVAGFWLNVPGTGRSCPSCSPTDPTLGAELLRDLA